MMFKRRYIKYVNKYGAPSFSQKLIQIVKNLIEHLNIQPEIIPTAMQTIQFEYDNSRRDHMEIEIGEDSEAELFIVYYNGQEVFETISSTVEEISQKVREFYE